MGRHGIGEVEQEKAYEAWEAGRQQKLDDFGAYLKRLHENSLPPTPLGQGTHKLALPLLPLDPDPLSSTVIEQRSRIVRPQDFGDLPQALKDLLQPKTELVIEFEPNAAAGHARIRTVSQQ